MANIKLNQLGDRLKGIIADTEKEIKKDANTAVYKAAVKVFSKIIKMTPVGNADLWQSKYKPVGYVGGRARANWFIGASLSNVTTSSTKDKGAGYVASAMPKEVLGNKTYLYNNLPYIESLEYGHSTQAPKGMVRASLLGWNRELNKAFKAQ